MGYQSLVVPSIKLNFGLNYKPWLVLCLGPMLQVLARRLTSSSAKSWKRTVLRFEPMPATLRVPKCSSIQVVKGPSYFLCSTNVPITRTRWVRLTFSNLCPLQSKQRQQEIPATSNISREKFPGMLVIKPRAAEWEARMLPPCYAEHTILISLPNFILNDQGTLFVEPATSPLWTTS